MGLLLYNIGLLLYRAFISLSMPFNTKASAFIKGRARQFEKMGSKLASGEVIWFHCASLGEFEQGRPLMEQFKLQHPDWKIVLTFFSPSGYEVRKNYEGADHIYYLPLDSRRNARKFLQIINPSIAVFVKYEFWYHYFKALSTQNIPIIVISSIFRNEQIFFKWYGGFYRKILTYCSHIFTQDQSSVDLLNTVQITNSRCAGDTRFDRVQKIKQENLSLPILDSFKGNEKIFIIGSSWSEDLDVLLPYINQPEVPFKFIIAPHEITEKGLTDIEDLLTVSSIRLSKADQYNVADARVLIVDSIGHLSKMYRYGSIAFIGGAYGDGLHNILEAATFGLPLFFGDKNYKKFREARELINLGGAYPIGNTAELITKLNPLLDQENCDIVSNKILTFIDSNTGATRIIMDYLNQKIDEGNSH